MATEKHFNSSIYRPITMEDDIKRMLSTHNSLRQIDIWWFGFLIGVTKTTFEEADLSSNFSSKINDTASQILDDERILMIESVFLNECGLEQQYDFTGLPANIIKFAHGYAYPGMQELKSKFNTIGNLDAAFFKALGQAGKDPDATELILG
jgi:hypothetical protein